MSKYLFYLNNYFNFHVRLSMVPFVTFVRPCVRKLTSIPAEVLQKVTNKSCLVCVNSKKCASWVTLRPLWDRYCRGKAEVRILHFKTTWSEFQKPSKTAAGRGGAELCILDFKTSWSEFQKPSQTAAKRGVAELRMLNFKTTWS